MKDEVGNRKKETGIAKAERAPGMGGFSESA
jgi:hypothetical protein